jgi:hypothetical protein
MTKRSKKIKNNRKKTQKFKKLNCSPAIDGKTPNRDSCFTDPVLKNLKESFNKSHPDQMIAATDPNEIWTELKMKLNTCSKEDCWLDTLKDESMKRKIKEMIFAPKHPPEWHENPTEWLTNFDIEKVMKQYELSEPTFKFIGPTTIDFDSKPEYWGGRCVLEDLCRFDLARFIRAKRTKIGIVFNLDKHDQSGSHWVSLYI